MVQQDPAPNRPRLMNAEEIAVEREALRPDSARPAPEQPDHSMHDEEPDGWDMAPHDIHERRNKRHPRKEGKGGTP